jgi:16S rRNA (guanine527-N7)-methyltransferase
MVTKFKEGGRGSKTPAPGPCIPELATCMEDSLPLLREGAAALGLALPEAVLTQFQAYLQELITWNARVNLTGLTSPRDMVIKHFLDSLAVLPYIEGAPSLADLGSGAGFPGMVLKLARPALTLTLVEPRGKKAAFLEYLAALWRLTGVEVIQTHLTPRLAKDWGPRFEVVVSRAAFALTNFLELAAPLLLPGGRALALKGPDLPSREIQAGEKCLGALSMDDLEFIAYRLPITGEARVLVVARKA